MPVVRSHRLVRGAFLIACAMFAVFILGQPQDEHRRTKVPLIGKIGGGSNRQAFSGKVQSVDLKRNLLMVDTVEGGTTEYFPVKKNVAVHTAAGEKIKVAELTPGTNVIVYFEVKNDRRTVSEIVVLGIADKPEAKKPAAPS